MEDENQNNILREIYEKEYAAFARKNPLFSFTYWKNKDDLGYYTGLLNELEKEAQKPLVFPRKIEKLFLILALCVSYYNTVPFPCEQVYWYLSATLFLLIFGMITREFFNMIYYNGLMLKVWKYQIYLSELKINNTNDIVKYHDIKLRILNLDTRIFLWTIDYWKHEADLHRNYLKRIREEEYSELVNSNRKFCFNYWRYVDEDRYYHELLKELEEENKKPINYSNIIEKVLLTLAVSISFYISSATPPEFTIHWYLSAFSIIFMLYFFIKELVCLGCGRHSFMTVSELYERLENKMNFSEKYFFNVMSQQNEDNRLKERYEVCYASLPDEKPNYKFVFWESKDEARYYTEILNNLDKEIKKINYPRIADKVYIILAVSASLYNTSPNPKMWLYLFLSGLAYLYAVFEILTEAYSMSFGNRSILEVSLYQGYLK
ncbi:hypothetical protein CAEBREN_21143 [Caenorhabditis brenneri]|uniref:Uncharacterized protein n=1 Tax=Caenorhabditis brenneri TaxID=135651 RepID=G0MA18_CAEBE|nr:hypothetical protein CAEBREN_21143 [Caenorhabditis brenneri]